VSLSAGPYSAEWSPDGSQLAFEEDVEGIQNIYVVKADGTKAINLTNNTTVEYPYQFWLEPPLWLADGKHILYSNEDTVYIANADGSGEVELFDRDKNPLQGFANAGPYLAPDGRTIAYWTPQGMIDPNGNIVIVNVDGTDLRTLTTEAQFPEVVWRPDGKE